jgi:hypothetical protein
MKQEATPVEPKGKRQNQIPVSRDFWDEQLHLLTSLVSLQILLSIGVSAEM